MTKRPANVRRRGGGMAKQRRRPVATVDYHAALLPLQVELVKLQREIIDSNRKILVVFEGRDAAGKDGTIKSITAHLSPRETRVVALSKPTARDRSSWYFQRFVHYLPAAHEMVIFTPTSHNPPPADPPIGLATKFAPHNTLTR